MPTIRFNIVATAATFPDGAQMTPNEFAAWLLENATFEVSGDSSGAISGQVGGSRPTSDIGPYFNTTDHTLELWDSTLGKYTPITTVPVGSMLPYPSAGAAPTNFLLAQGQQLNVADYPALFAILGTTWNKPADADATKFRLPDPTYRVPLGSGIGQTKTPDVDGKNLNAIVNVGDYTGEIFPRNIATPANAQTGKTAYQNIKTSGASTGAINQKDTTTVASVVQPSFVTQWIIKAK